MRFTDQNNAVHLLMENDRSQVGISTNSTEFRAAAFFINSEFPALKPLFRTSIQYLCRPFLEAYLKAKEKLAEVLQKEPIEKSGTLIYADLLGDKLTIFYNLTTLYKGEEMVANGRIAIFANVSGVRAPQLIFYTRITNNHTATFQPLDTLRQGFRDQSQINDTLCLILFIKYCSVETRIVARGKKVSHKREEYLNKTSLPIEILDSGWFTTVVRSEGFGVGGHFRLQPVGPGRIERKLIWIAPYEKKGYVRNAGVLRNTGDSGEQA